MAQWSSIIHAPGHGLIPDQGTLPGFRTQSPVGSVHEATGDDSLITDVSFSLPDINKNTLFRKLMFISRVSIRMFSQRAVVQVGTPRLNHI